MKLGVSSNKMEQRRVIISILTWNQRRLIQDCLESIFSTCRHSNYRICVFEQHTHDGTRTYLASLGDRIDVIHSPENLGFVLGNNQVFHSYPECDILLLNDDTVVMPGWLEALTHTAYSESNIGIVGSKLVYPNGVLQEAGSVIYQDGTGCNVGKWDDPTKPEYNYRRDVDYCSGASIYIRRDALDAVGGQFDERFAPAYYEDTDLSFSIRQAGFRVVYEPNSVVFHREGATAGTDLTSGFKKYQVINREHFVQKWDEVLRARHRRGYFDVPSNGKPKVLVIGRSPIMPDMASGELRFWRALEVLSETHHIVFLAVDALGADRYVSDMEDAGMTVFQNDVNRWGNFGFSHDIPKGTKIVDLDALLTQNDFTFVYAYFPDVGAVYLPIVRKLRPEIPVVVDSVDIVFLREWREIELKQDLAVLANFDQSRRTELRTYRAADRVITVTETDREALLKYAPEIDVKVLTNVHPIVETTPQREGRSGILFIGGFGHRPNVDAAQWLVEKIMPKVWEVLPEVHLILCGSSPTSEVHALAEDRVTVTGWVPKTEPYIARTLVSVAPLRYGAGMKGKVGEALACGLPVVTTTVGAEGMDLVDGMHARIADDAESFAAAVIQVLSEDDVWRRLSYQGKTHVNHLWGYTAIRVQWQAITNNLVRCNRDEKPCFNLSASSWHFGSPLPGSREMAIIADTSAPLSERLHLYERIRPSHTGIFVVLPPRQAAKLAPWCEERCVRYLVSQSDDPVKAAFEAMDASTAESLLIARSSILPLASTARRLLDTVTSDNETLAAMGTVFAPFSDEGLSDFQLRMSTLTESPLHWSPASIDTRCFAVNRQKISALTKQRFEELTPSSSFWNSRVVQSPQLICADAVTHTAAPIVSPPRVPASNRPSLAVLIPIFDASIDEFSLVNAYAVSARRVSGKVHLYLAECEGFDKKKLTDISDINVEFIVPQTPTVGAAIEAVLSKTASEFLMVVSPHLIPNPESLKGAVNAISIPSTNCAFSATSERGFFHWHTPNAEKDRISPHLEMMVSPCITWRTAELRRSIRPAALESLTVYALRRLAGTESDCFQTSMKEGTQFEMTLPPWKLPDNFINRVATDLWRISEADGEKKLATLAALVSKYGQLSSTLTTSASEIYEVLKKLPLAQQSGPMIQGAPLRSQLYTLLTRAAVYSKLVVKVEAFGEKRMREVLRHRFPKLQLQKKFAEAMPLILSTLFNEFIGENNEAFVLAETAWHIAPDCPSAAFQYARSLMTRRRFAEAAPLFENAVNHYRQVGEEELLSISNPVSASLYLAHCYLVLGRGSEVEKIVRSVQHDNPQLAPEVRAAFLKILSTLLRKQSRITESAVVDSYLVQLQPGIADRLSTTQ